MLRALASVSGYLCLAVSAGLIVVAPPSLLTVGLAGLAVALLGRTSSYGPLGAGLAVTLALPFGRGADVETLHVFGLPIRPQDATIAVAALLALPTVRRPRSDTHRCLALIGAFLAVGALALVVGLLNKNELWDVARDLRWWALYAVFGVALLIGSERGQVLRGLWLGLGVLASVVLAAGILPAFEGGLKSQIIEYDRGTIRMQFGNSQFLLLGIAYAATRLVTKPSAYAAVALLGLQAALTLSLTRISVLVMLAMVVLVVALRIRQEADRLRAFARGIPLYAFFLSLGLVGGVGIATLATTLPTETVDRTQRSAQPEWPLQRLLFQSDQSDVESIVASAFGGGRLATYEEALQSLRDSPLVGLGFGSLIRVEFAYNEARARTYKMQPGVDNAWLTIALKAGLLGIVAFAGLVIAPVLAAARQPDLRSWYVPGWLAILTLTLTQSGSVSSYGPFCVALLAAVPFLGYAATSARAADAAVYRSAS